MVAKVIEDIAGARDAMVYGGTKIKAVVDGPATGPDSLVETASGPVKTLARLQSEYGVGTLPGYATATTVDGQVLVSSGPMVSPIGRIKRVADAGDGFYKCQSRKKHDLVDGDLVVVSADGWHGVTHREHPVNSPWESNAAGTEIDVGYWPIEVINPYWFRVPVEVVADSVFGQGQFWKHDAVLIDAHPIYVDLKDRVLAAGGGTIKFPGGHIWSTDKFLKEEGVNLQGAGENVTFFVAADRVDDHFFQHVGEGDFSFTDATLCCRRHRQDLTKGLHGIRLGANGVIQRRITIKRVTIEAPAGYACAGQSSGAFIDCDFELKGGMSEADFFDDKNRLSQNDNNRISADIEHFGLYRIGTNYAAYALPTDPFTTVNGSSIVTIRHPGQEFSVGIRSTLPNGGTFNGIDLTGTWEIVGKVQNGYTINVWPQVANASSTGGGAGKLEWASQFSSGDAAVDLRGKGWTVGTIKAKSDMRSRGAARWRNGEVGSDNGLGAVQSGGGVVYAINTHASRTNALGAILGGRGIAVPVVIGENLSRCVSFLPQSSANSVSQVQALNCGVAVSMTGNDNSAGIVTAQTCGTGWAASDSDAVDIDFLEEDAFEATADSNVVKVKRVNHGKTTGALVTIADARPEFDVTPNGVKQAITFVDADHFSIVASSNATDSGFFGGENATISWGEPVTGKNLKVGLLQTIGCTVGAHIYEGVVGAQIGNRSSNGDTLDIIDAGTGTILYPALTIHPETHKWASAIITAGGILTTAERDRMDVFIQGDVADGNWEWDDDIFIVGAVADPVASRVSLKRRVLATVANGAIFTAYRGWTGDAVSAALGLRFTPSINATKMSGGNIRLWWWQLNNVAGTKSIMGVSSGQSVRGRPRGTSDTMGVQVTSALTSFPDAVTDSSGYGDVQRSGGSTIEGQKNNTALTDVIGTALSNSLPTGEIYALARNNSGSISEPTDGQLFACGFGAPRSLVDRNARYARLLALAQAVGAVAP